MSDDQRAARSDRDARIRLFVALELPEGAARALQAWAENIVGGAAGLRALSRESLHVTLCFLGWQTTAAVDGVVDACDLVARLPPAHIAVGGARWLPARRPRVLAVELLDHDARLGAVQSALSDALHGAGYYEPERRVYLPHVTVARIGRRARATPGPPSSPPPRLEFAGETVTVFRSTLTPAGARYEALASIQLAGAG